MSTAELFRQRHDAERQRYPRPLGRRRLHIPARTFDPHHLGGTATDIEQDRPLGVDIKQRRTADRGQRGFGFAVDNFELDAGFALDQIEKRIGIVRRPASLRGDGAQPFGALGADFVPAHAQGAHGARDGGIADTARGGDALAQPDDARKRIDHAKPVMGHARDQQAAIVGAKIQRGIRRRHGRSAILAAIQHIPRRRS